jgi:hypothetical protein
MGQFPVQGYLAQIIHDIFQFNTVWHRQPMAAHVWCWRLAESGLKMLVIKHVADVVPPSTTLAFIKMNEKHKSPSPSVIQVKNQ